MLYGAVAINLWLNEKSFFKGMQNAMTRLLLHPRLLKRSDTNIMQFILGLTLSLFTKEACFQTIQ